jgi:hypothetical protein
VRPRYRGQPKKDTNHKEIVEGLRRYGCSVLELHAVGGGCPDLLVGRCGWDRLVEVKIPDHLRQRRGATHEATRERQQRFRDLWRGATVVQVTCLEEALAAVGVLTSR